MQTEILKKALIAAGIPAASITEDLDSVCEGIQGSDALIIDKEIFADVWQEGKEKIQGVVIWTENAHTGASVICDDMAQMVAAVLQARREIEKRQKEQKCTLH